MYAQVHKALNRHAREKTGGGEGPAIQKVH